VVPACVIGTGRVTHHVVDDCLWEQPLQHVRNTSADTNSVHTEVAAADSLCVPSNPLSGLYGVKASPRVQNLGVLSVTDKRDVLVRTEPRNVNTHDGRCVLVLLPLGLDRSLNKRAVEQTIIGGIGELSENLGDIAVRLLAPVPTTRLDPLRLRKRLCQVLRHPLTREVRRVERRDGDEVPVIGLLAEDTPKLGVGVIRVPDSQNTVHRGRGGGLCTRVNGLRDAASLIKDYQETVRALRAQEYVYVEVGSPTSLLHEGAHRASVLHAPERPAVTLRVAPCGVALEVKITKLLPRLAVDLFVGGSGRD